MLKDVTQISDTGLKFAVKSLPMFYNCTMKNIVCTEHTCMDTCICSYIRTYKTVHTYAHTVYIPSLHNT